MKAKIGKDLTVGSVPKHLLSFSIPMVIGNLLTVGYSIINTVWVGNTFGKDGIGASAVSFPITLMLIAIVLGATLATTILVSQYYGANDHAMVQKIVNTSFTISIILSVALTIISILLSGLLLKLMNTPQEIFSLALNYLRICLLGFVFMYLGLLVPAILRGIGDTITPLIFLAIGTGLNAILDPLLIIGVGPFPKLGLNGAALASIISQAVAAIIGIIYLNRKYQFLAFKLTKLELDKHITFLIFKIGFPCIIQQSLLSIGSAFITTFVNAFGVVAANAFGAVGKVDSLAIMPAMSLGMAVSALTGQNIGAGKLYRVKDIFRWGIIITSVITIFFSILVVSCPNIILDILGFGSDTEAMKIGVTYLRMVGASYILFATLFVSNGVINGSGNTVVTMVFSILSQLGIRVPFAAILSHTSLGITGIWIAVILSFAVTLLISLTYYYCGKWKKSVIQFNPSPDLETRDTM